MRLTRVLFGAPSQKDARRYQLEPVPFQQLLPLKLKKTVSGKSDKTTEASCLQELGVMFACLKQNEFNQNMCSKEVESFQVCYTIHKEARSKLREQEKKGILVPGEKKLTHRQMNLLLRKFPPLK